MKHTLDKAVEMALVVAEDKEMFAQSKWAAQKILDFCGTTFLRTRRGVLVLAFLLVLKSLIEAEFPEEKS